MASFYSKPAEYGTYTQPINLEMVNFVMSSRQQKYDYNLAKVESKIADQLGSIDLARTQDKEYFLKRAEQVIGGMGDISKLDWSKNGVTRQVDDKLNSIVDDRILGDVISTKNYRSFQSTLQEKQKAGDGTYSTTNAAYAMETQGVNKWLKGETDSVGSVQYQDYVDIPTQLKDISENLDKYAKDIKTFTDPTGQRRYMTTEGKVLTSQQVKAIAEQQLTGPAREQMRINGWAHYDGGVKSTGEIAGEFQKWAKKDLSKFDGQIAAIDLKIEQLGDSDPTKVKTLEAQKTSLTNARSGRASEYDRWVNGGDKANMYTTMESENVLGRFGDTFAINDVKRTLVDNTYELKKFDEELKRETQRQKSLLDLQKKAMEETENPYQVITPTMKPGDVDRSNELDRDVSRYNEGYKNSIMGVYGALGSETKSNIDKAYEASGKEQPKEQFIYDQLMGVGENKGLATAVQKQEILTSKIRRDKALDIRDEAREYAFQTMETANMEQLIEEAINSDWRSAMNLANRNDFQMLDQAGNPVSVEEYFRKNGVTSKEDVKRKPEVFKNFLKAMYTERVLANGLNPELTGMLMASASAPGVYISPGTVASMAVGDDQSGLFLDRIVDLFDGDEKAALQHIAKSREAGLAPNSIGDYVSGFFKNIPHVGALIDDDKFNEDNWINSTFNEENVKREVGKYLNQNQLTATTNQVIVDKDSPQGNDLMQVLSTQTALMEGLPGDVSMAKDQPMTLQDLGNGMVRAYVKVKVPGGKGEVETRTTTLPVTNLPDRIEQEIKFGEQRAVIDQNNMAPTEGRAIYYDDTDDRGIAGFAQMGRKSFAEAGAVATKGGVTKGAFFRFSPVMGTQSEPTVLGEAIKNMINSDNLVAEVVKDPGSGMFRNKISYIDPTTNKKMGIHVYKSPINPNEYERQYFNTQLAPQILITDFIQKALTDVMTSGGQITPEAQKIIDIYGGGVSN